MHHTPLVQQLRDISFAKTLSGLHQCRQYKARRAACHAVTILAWPIWLKDEITEYMQRSESLHGQVVAQIQVAAAKTRLEKNVELQVRCSLRLKKQGQLHISRHRVNPSGAALNVLQFGFPASLRHGWTMLFELGQPQLGHCGCRL